MQISRTALVPFVVFFSAWETLQGIATGILAADYRSQPQARRLQSSEISAARLALGGLTARGPEVAAGQARRR